LTHLEGRSHRPGKQSARGGKINILNNKIFSALNRF